MHISEGLNEVYATIEKSIMQSNALQSKVLFYRLGAMQFTLIIDVDNIVHIKKKKHTIIPIPNQVNALVIKTVIVVV